MKKAETQKFFDQFFDTKRCALMSTFICKKQNSKICNNKKVIQKKLFWWYSKTSLNRTLLFQKVVRFSKISVYTKCRIAPANRRKFGLGGGFSDVSDHSSKPSEVRISAQAVERGDASKFMYIHTYVAM